ncbi:PREDICTED: psbP domain-containing protein 1, chloroplastic isoform X2 [Nelumbo nucifera]|uniref:PsbP domain-containing protein 1, chloroplastic isoform X2 n=1 Tax=Nelumbo nucifera TaxID=4432 RepID=A0A1U8QA08_NELNU|nr:PREDICTED: psbP domain-containing protein 1, chloroplastic isoform X2 [Nelumbo nucifera]
MAAVLESVPSPHSSHPRTAVSRRRRPFVWTHTGTSPLRFLSATSPNTASRRRGIFCEAQNVPSRVPRRNVMTLMLSSFIFSQVGFHDSSLAQPSIGFREYIDTFDGYTFKYPQNWIQVRGAGADIFFRDPFVLDENISVEVSSPSSSKYKSVEDLGPPQKAGEKVLKQYLTEFMSTRLGVRRESNILSTSSRVADDGKIYYQVEINIKSYANNNELAVMPQERIVRLEWNRRYLSVLGVENNRLYELRLQTPENVFLEEENDLRQVMDSFRVVKVAA